MRGYKLLTAPSLFKPTTEEEKVGKPGKRQTIRERLVKVLTEEQLLPILKDMHLQCRPLRAL